MNEIFADIPQYVKDNVKFWTDMALRQRNPWSAVQIINEYIDSCINEEEKEFSRFYFKMRLEQLRNESDSHIS